jgi:hypothetical protein
VLQPAAENPIRQIGSSASAQLFVLTELQNAQRKKGFFFQLKGLEGPINSFVFLRELARDKWLVVRVSPSEDLTFIQFVDSSRITAGGR